METTEIIGSDIDSLIEEAIKVIREKSREFYRKHLRENLTNKKYCLIDVHAARGHYYKVVLI